MRNNLIQLLIFIFIRGIHKNTNPSTIIYTRLIYTQLT